jgi:hypothetical protein
MEVSGQLHALAALPPGKEPSVTIVWEAGLPSEPVEAGGKRIISATGGNNFQYVHKPLPRSPEHVTCGLLQLLSL